jgi:hypothetical protein
MASTYLLSNISPAVSKVAKNPYHELKVYFMVQITTALVFLQGSFNH